MRRFATAETALVGAMIISGGTFAGVSARTTAFPTILDSAEPASREVVLPAGTVLPLSLDSYVASDRSRLEDAVRAHVRRAIVVNGTTVIPAGSTVIGNVTSVARPGRIKGRGHVAFRFHALTMHGNGRVPIRTSSVSRTAAATKGEDASKIALPAAGGAIIGAITGGKKGAAIGASAGGGAGTAVVLSTRGRDVRLGPGATVTVRLLKPVRLIVG